MNWRVMVKYGYTDICFDFEDVSEAADFCTSMLTSFNRSVSYDKKELYVSLKPFDPEKEHFNEED